MNLFLDKYTEQRIEQIYKSSQSVSNKEVISAENIKDIDVDRKFFKILKQLFELNKQRNVIKERRRMIYSIKLKLKKLFQNVTTSQDTKFDNIIALAIAYQYMGRIYTHHYKLVKHNSALSTAEFYYQRCIKLLNGKELDCKAILTIIRVHIDLHDVLCQLGQSDSDYSLLDTVMELYSKYTKETIEYPDPIDFTVILGVNFEETQNSKVSLEQLHLFVLKNLSSVYFDYCENKHSGFVIHIHNILSKRIEETMASNENMLYWAAASLELSYYFLQNSLFTEARNHIAAAEYMTEIFQRNVLMTKDQEDPAIQTQLYKLFKIVCGYVARYWGTYGVQLLIDSNERLMQKRVNEYRRQILCETDNSKSESVMESKENLLIFTNLEMDLKNFTAQFSDKYVSNSFNAKNIFRNVLKQLDTAHQYFSENMFFFLEKTLLTSAAIEYLTNFEGNGYEKMSLTMQREKVLENALKQINMNSTLKSFATESNMLDLIYEQLTKISDDLYHPYYF